MGAASQLLLAPTLQSMREAWQLLPHTRAENITRKLLQRAPEENAEVAGQAGQASLWDGAMRNAMGSFILQLIKNRIFTDDCSASLISNCFPLGFSSDLLKCPKFQIFPHMAVEGERNGAIQNPSKILVQLGYGINQWVSVQKKMGWFWFLLCVL